MLPPLDLSPLQALPLQGQTALVTGVSRRRGIGFATAAEFARLGASVFIHHYAPHDADQPWGADDLDEVRSTLRRMLTPGALLGDASTDLREPQAAASVIARAHELTRGLDILVCNQALSGRDGSILDTDAGMLDAHWQVNARATLLLTRAFARLHVGQAADAEDSADAGDSAAASSTRPGERLPRTAPFAAPTGRVFWMTSGQLHGPMRGEVAYAASKAALAGVTPTVAAELLELGILLNTIDPGPVNTGYLDPDTTDRPLDDALAWAQSSPFGRFGLPSDPARLIGWLATPAGGWITGQVITTDGGLGLA